MKLAIVADPHFGIRDNSMNFFTYQEKFFKEILVPECVKQEITDIVFLGDFFHNRHSVNIRILHHVKQLFKELSNKFTLHGLTGNHDLFFKNDYTIDLPKNVLSEYVTFTKDNGVGIIGTNCLMVDWRNSKQEYLEKFNSLISSSNNQWPKYLFGHFEFYNSLMSHSNRNENADSLMSEEIKATFPNLLRIFSGHYHIPQPMYVGTPYQLTWGEYGIDLGFNILDTETDEVTFIRNPLQMFKSIDVDSFCGDLIIDEPGYKMNYRLKYTKAENSVKADQYAGQIKEKGHSVVIANNILYSTLQQKEISTDVNLSIESLMDKYFAEHLTVLKEEEDKAAFRELFKQMFNDTRNSLDSAEGLL